MGRLQLAPPIPSESRPAPLLKPEGACCPPSSARAAGGARGVTASTALLDVSPLSHELFVLHNLDVLLLRSCRNGLKVVDLFTGQSSHRDPQLLAFDRDTQTLEERADAPAGPSPAAQDEHGLRDDQPGKSNGGERSLGFCLRRAVACSALFRAVRREEHANIHASGACDLRHAHRFRHLELLLLIQRLLAAAARILLADTDEHRHCFVERARLDGRKWALNAAVSILLDTR